jgi:hypothetical protein
METMAVLTEKTPFKVVLMMNDFLTEEEMNEHTYTVRPCISYEELIDGFEKTPFFKTDFRNVEEYNKAIKKRETIFREGRHSDYYFVMDNNENFGRIIYKGRFKRFK